jgi:hypothetical protein
MRRPPTEKRDLRQVAQAAAIHGPHRAGRRCPHRDRRDAQVFPRSGRGGRQRARSFPRRTTLPSGQRVPRVPAVPRGVEVGDGLLCDPLATFLRSGPRLPVTARSGRRDRRVREPQPRRSDRRFDAGQGQIQRRNRSLIVSSCLSTRSLTAACCSGETSSVRRSTGRSGVPCADVIALQDYSPIDDAGVGHGHVPRSHPSCTVGGTRRGEASSAPDDRADPDRTCHADTAMAGSGPSAARGGVRWMPRRA